MAGKNTVSAPSENDWQAEDDMRTLARAQVIRDDPKRFKAALAKAQEQIDSLEALAGEDD